MGWKLNSNVYAAIRRGLVSACCDRGDGLIVSSKFCFAQSGNKFTEICVVEFGNLSASQFEHEEPDSLVSGLSASRRTDGNPSFVNRAIKVAQFNKPRHNRAIFLPNRAK
jgi:hypothetical protein